MSLWLKQSTARTIHIGPFVDDTDGKTAETALTLSQADIRLSKNGGDIAQKNEASACTHDELGYYTCALDTTDTNTLGHLKLMVHESGALPVFMDMMVVPANVWDSMFGADYLKTEVVEISGDATAADNAEAFFDGTGYAGTNNVIPTVTTVTNLHASAATAAELAKVPKSDGSASWNATALAAINAEVDGALNTAIPGSPTADSINERVATMDGRILGTLAAGTHNAQTGDAYARLGAPAGASVSADIAAVKTDTGNLVTRITSSLFSGITSLAQWLGMIAGKQVGNTTARTEIRATGAGSGTFDETTDSVEAIRDRGDTAWGAGAVPSVAQIADGVWDEASADHNAAGTMGNKLNSAASAGDPWTTSLPGAYAGGTAGKIVGDLANEPLALTVITPVRADGTAIELVQGDDYDNDDDRALGWSSGEWPDLTGGSVTFYLDRAAGVFSKAGTLETVGAGVTQSIYVELTDTETATFDIGTEDFQVLATLASGNKVTLAIGKCRVIDNV